MMHHMTITIANEDGHLIHLTLNDNNTDPIRTVVVEMGDDTREFSLDELYRALEVFRNRTWGPKPEAA